MRPPGTNRATALRHAPTVATIAVLAALGVYGHHTDWTLPRLSALGSPPREQEAWCESHGVPESQCVECRAELMPRGPDYGWCRTHGVENCPLCHPDASQLRQPPESVSETDLARAVAALALAPRAENNPICKNYRRRIQFASLEAVDKAGLDVAVAERQAVCESIAAAGEITYDQTRFASLSSRLPGTAWQVEHNVGDRVRRGDVLALIDAAEVGQAKAELLQALAEESLQRKAFQRIGSLSTDGVLAGREVQTVEAAYVQAQARLDGASQALANLGLPVSIDLLRKLTPPEMAERIRLLGIPDELASRISGQGATSNLLPLASPLDGLVVARQVVSGETVDASRMLFQVADTDRMWLKLNVSLEEADRLAVGQTVAFLPDGSRHEAVGKLFWISTSVDRPTRTVAALAELPNAAGRLRDETFGRGRVILREDPQAVVVPNEAVQWEGCCHVVFVRDKAYFDSADSPKVFHVRTVRPGVRGEKYTEIIAGVLPGEIVATQGSDVLRAQLLKNNLGEGCCAE